MPLPISTDLTDFDQIRAYINPNLDESDLPDRVIASLPFLQSSELIIKKLVNATAVQTNGASPTIDQILDEDGPISPASADDVIALRAATTAYVAYRAMPGLLAQAKTVTVTKTVGDAKTEHRTGAATRSSGNSELELTTRQQMAFNDVGMFLSMITGWPEQNQNIFGLSGPTSSGTVPDTVSGFWLAGY